MRRPKSLPHCLPRAGGDPFGIWYGANAWNDSAWSRYKNTREFPGAEKMSRTQHLSLKINVSIHHILNALGEWLKINFNTLAKSKAQCIGNGENIDAFLKNRPHNRADKACRRERHADEAQKHSPNRALGRNFSCIDA
ncbi:hypothetical protein Lgee_1506 [Legionella geestiana]|uniref:Uncharacterized protein n=1 Tax=Legionella geestiana TaxID=45065 RepID=A0A0W0TSY8_9GAMM|nr:hypothetical protein Lgee_1506 [Legionella geestiana]STX54698.1 Uncharacterised protein [Legionella geestiana]